LTATTLEKITIGLTLKNMHIGCTFSQHNLSVFVAKFISNEHNF